MSKRSRKSCTKIPWFTLVLAIFQTASKKKCSPRIPRPSPFFARLFHTDKIRNSMAKESNIVFYHSLPPLSSSSFLFFSYSIFLSCSVFSRDEGVSLGVIVQRPCEKIQRMNSRDKFPLNCVCQSFASIKSTWSEINWSIGRLISLRKLMKCF